MVLAWVYITMAMEGRLVNIIDHVYIMHSDKFANKLLAEKIAGIISEDNLPLEIDKNRDGFVLRSKVLQN